MVELWFLVCVNKVLEMRYWKPLHWKLYYRREIGFSSNVQNFLSVLSLFTCTWLEYTTSFSSLLLPVESIPIFKNDTYTKHSIFQKKKKKPLCFILTIAMEFPLNKTIGNTWKYPVFWRYSNDSYFLLLFYVLETVKVNTIKYKYCGTLEYIKCPNQVLFFFFFKHFWFLCKCLVSMVFCRIHFSSVTYKMKFQAENIWSLLDGRKRV